MPGASRTNQRPTRPSRGPAARATRSTEEDATAGRATEDALLRRWIRPHPHKSGPEDVVLVESLVPVYAIIGYLPVADGDLDRVADAYAVPRAAVEAALTYYRRHRAVIDARIFNGSAKVSDAS